MRRIDRRRQERLRRRLVSFGISFALGALVATLLTDRLQRRASHSPEPLPIATTGEAESSGGRPPRAPAVEAAAPSMTEAIADLAGRNLLIPVDGVTANRLMDTFNDSRALARRHDAIDIMAPRGTEVRAADDGTIAKLFTSKAGGLTIYQFDRRRPSRITTRTSTATRLASPSTSRYAVDSFSDTLAAQATPPKTRRIFISRLHVSARIGRGGRAIRSIRIPCSQSELTKSTQLLQSAAPGVVMVLRHFSDNNTAGGRSRGAADAHVWAQVSEGVNWVTAIAMGAFHVGAIAAFFFVTKGALLAALILYFVGGMLGIGMAYHRLLTHRGYKTYKWVEYFLTFCGTLALEGGPIFWVATHRIHHQKSDRKATRTRRAKAPGGPTWDGF
jgi:hypothetical protein